MDTFDLLLEASAPKRVPKSLPPIAGWLCAAIIACIVSVLPRTRSLSWGDLLLSSVERVLAVFLIGIITAWMLYSIADRDHGANGRLAALRAATAALWLTPLALFLRENSVWAMALAAILASSIAPLLRGRSVADRLPDSCLFSLNGYAASPPATSLRFRPLSFALAALIAQAGVVAGFAGYTFTAALMVAVSSAFWTWSSPSEPNDPRSRPVSFNRLSLALTLSILFTALGLMSYLRRTPRLRGFGFPSQAHLRHPTAQAHGGGPAPYEHPSEGPATGSEEGNAGIVLWPEKLVRTKLVAPSPIFGNSRLDHSRSSDPLVIPFNGVYWFFKAPDMHPPRSSRQAHGSPEVLSIRSTDLRPLSMEAHENLGTMIDLACCSRIQVVIRNADRIPRTVSLELILINSSLPGMPSQSLGRSMVESSQPWRIYDQQRMTHETLNFSIPTRPSIRRFDEIKVVFRLDHARSDYAARVAVDRFVLIPRGL